jgi:hypothetical protein
MGAIFGVSAFFHGFFEVQQGNRPTGGLFIEAIGEAQRMWPHGNEPAFTLIPNFLVTGIVTMLLGLGIVLWSLGFVHKRHGAVVLMGLLIASLLTGGGVAQIIFFPWFWLVAARIRGTLPWWRKVLSSRALVLLSRLWPLSLALAAGMMALALEIAVTGFVPGVSNTDTALSVMMFCLVGVLLLLPLVAVAGFARDLARRAGNE